MLTEGGQRYTVKRRRGRETKDDGESDGPLDVDRSG
jgi:hypothetical protein